MTNTHLSRDERHQTQVLHSGGHSSREIAELLERDRRTVSRQLCRNASVVVYNVPRVHRLSTQRRHVASAQSRIAGGLWQRVEVRLKEDWNPEQITGLGDVATSQEHIYQHIADGRQRGGAFWMHSSGQN